MLDPRQLVREVIRPALDAIRLNSDAAVALILNTGAQESHLTYLHQLGSGPAKGLFQMEPATHNDIWRHYLRWKPILAHRVKKLLVPGVERVEQLEGNLYYAAAMCRVHYLRVPEPLPAASDIAGQARYWKRYYNTPLGAGTEQEFIRNALETET